MKFLTKRDDENKSRSGLISQLRTPPRKKIRRLWSERTHTTSGKAAVRSEREKMRTDIAVVLSGFLFEPRAGSVHQRRLVERGHPSRKGNALKPQQTGNAFKTWPDRWRHRRRMFPLFLLTFKSKPGFNDSRETIKPQSVCSPFVIQVWSSGAKHKHAGWPVNDATHQRRWM